MAGHTRFGIGHAYNASSQWRNYWTQAFGSDKAGLDQSCLTTTQQVTLAPTTTQQEVTLAPNTPLWITKKQTRCKSEDKNLHHLKDMSLTEAQEYCADSSSCFGVMMNVGTSKKWKGKVQFCSEPIALDSSADTVSNHGWDLYIHVIQ